MTTSLRNFNIRKDIMSTLLFLSTRKNIELNEYNEYIDKILQSFVKLIDSKKQEYEKEQNDHLGDADYNVNHYNLTEKIEALDELKEILEGKEKP